MGWATEKRSNVSKNLVVDRNAWKSFMKNHSTNASMEKNVKANMLTMSEAKTYESILCESI